MLRLLLIFPILLAYPAIMDGTAAAPPAADMISAQFAECGSAKRITCVVDGDTLWHLGTKIRLADIDTPEVSRPACAQERRLGERATRRLITLLNAAPFRLEQQGRDEDRYGRKLRVAMRGSRSLGEILVAEGLARRWTGQREPWC